MGMGYTREALLQVGAPPEPTGFAEFWRGTYQAALAIPLRIQHRSIAATHRGFITHEIEFDSWEGVRIGGWITLPEDGTFDIAVVMGHGYGGREAPDAWPRALTISPCARGFHRSAHPRLPDNAMEHVLLGIENRDTYVHRGCVVDFWCGASALLELYPAAAKRLSFRGTSFGGGIGAHVLAWDPRFQRGVLDVPSFGNYPLRVQLPCVGSGAAVRQYWRKHPEVLDVLAYYDSASAARHVQVPTLVSPALFDPAVPPPGQFAVANPLPGKELFVKGFGHFIDRIEVRESRELEKRIAAFLLE
jgi:cephalosporin-C deacetylase